MEKIPNDPIKKFAETISKDTKLLKKQLQEVEEKYPLVMVAYRIQQVMITELSMATATKYSELGPLYASIEPFKTDSMAKAEVEQGQRLTNLRDCLRRSHMSGSSGEQYHAGLGCFNKYVKGDDREVVDDA